MKNSLILVLVAVFLMTACAEQKTMNDTLSVSPMKVDFAANDNGKQTVSVVTNVDSWNISKSDNWIITEKVSDDKFSVDVQDNAGTEPRIGTITVTAGKAESVTVTVTQEVLTDEDILLVNPTELEFAADDSETQTVTVTTNVTNWNISKSVSWIIVNKNSDDTFSVAVEKNSETNERTGIIVVMAGKAESLSINVTQLAAEEVEVPVNWAAYPEMRELRAFPGAEGYGQNVSGGRGGKVVYVTNLDDSGTGSLRWALSQHPGQPIIVMFRISGLIELQTDLRVKRDDYTIAGQTAPGDGICIKGAKVNLGGSTNFILRHIRFRIGIIENAAGKGSIGVENASNFIIDHCTFGWSGEENMTIYDNKMTTIQWCIIHEGLYECGHDKGRRGYGTQWGGETSTYHHNLLAHNNSRSPRFNGARSNDRNVLIDYVNNVNYNWGGQNACYGGDIEHISHRVNFVNNYYKPGPARPGTQASNFIRSSYHANQSTSGRVAVWYMSGNYMEGSANASKNTDNYFGLNIGDYPSGTSIDRFKSPTPFEVPFPVVTETAQEAYLSVLAGAGAFPRDAVDTRIIDEVQTGTALGSGVFDNNRSNSGIIDDPAVVGGYPTYTSTTPPLDSDEDGIPDEWEIFYGLNPHEPADGVLKNLSGGTYTNLEVYLYDLVRKK